MSIRDNLRQAVHELGRSAERILHGVREAEQSTALSQFLQPNLGSTPPALRQVLEPVVAGAALLALALLAGVGFFSFLTFAAAALLMYAIITQVFGIELDFQPPSV